MGARHLAGVTFTVHDYPDGFDLIAHEDRRIALDMPELLGEIAALTAPRPTLTTAEFPRALGR